MSSCPKPIVLAIIDGLGLAPDSSTNAASRIHIPHFSRLWQAYAHTQLAASGESVGLPKKEPGNTETGHLNIGAGRIVYQDLPRINLSIADGSFFQNPGFLGAILHAQKNHSRLHLLGLVGGGGVHSELAHLYALLRLCREKNFTNVFVHVITDGRDSPPSASQTYIAQLQNLMARESVGQIASVMGRYFALDRDFRWDRTAQAYFCLTGGQGKTAPDIQTAISNSYAAGKTDEFIPPTLILDSGLIRDHDSVIFFNFRIDRPRQLTKAFVLPDFSQSANISDFDPYAVRYGQTHTTSPLPSAPFTRGRPLSDLFFVTMTEYQKDLPVHVAFPPLQLDSTLGQVISASNLTQLHAAESEKERFVTYYFNGLRESPFPGEDRLIIPSPQVATYDLKPEMSAFKLTSQLLPRISSLRYDFIVVNYANPDMVAHTGNLPAAIVACQAVDTCVGRLADLVLSLQGVFLLTSDHGNVEDMTDTEHNSSPVPFIIAAPSYPASLPLPSGILADISPSILSIMGLPQPAQMTGHTLISPSLLSR